MRQSVKPGTRASIVLLIVAVALAAGAGTADAKKKKKKAEVAEPELLQLVWPEPPLEPRIKFLQSYSDERHLGRKPTRREMLMEFFAGAAPPRSHLYQPMDIVVSDDGQRFYVADFARTEVFLFDFETKRVTLIGETRPFNRPFGLALDEQENLYVVEQGGMSVRILNEQVEQATVGLRCVSHDTARLARVVVEVVEL